VSPIIRLIPPLPTLLPHRRCPPPSQPLLSITRSPGQSLLSTPLSPLPLARQCLPTRTSPSSATVRLSTAKLPTSICSALPSTPGHRISTAPFIILPPWSPTFGARFVTTGVSHSHCTGPASLLALVFSKRLFNGLTTIPPTDPARYSIIHDIYQHSGSAAESSSAPEQGYLILSVEYRFTYAESPYSSPQLSPVESLSSNNSSLPSPSSYNVSCFPFLPRNQRT